MELQIIYCNHFEISNEGAVREMSKASWGSGAGTVPATGDRSSRRASDAGPCAHVSKHSSKIQCCICDRVHQREECSSDPPADIGEQTIDGAALLVPGILCEHSGPG